MSRNKDDPKIFPCCLGNNADNSKLMETKIFPMSMPKFDLNYT